MEYILSKLNQDEIWALLELRADLTFPYLERAAQVNLVQGALKTGEEWAVPYLGRSVEEMVRAQGLVIRDQDLGSRIRAAYEPGTIFLNRRALEEMARELAFLPLSLAQLEEATLAHEFFHHLEETTGTYAHHQFPPVATLKLGPWKKKTRVTALREIAAHRFAKELAGLTFLPNALDHLLTALHKPNFRRELALLLKEGAVALNIS